MADNHSHSEKPVSTAENNSAGEDSHYIAISRDDGEGQAEKIEGVKSGLGDAKAKVQASSSPQRATPRLQPHTHFSTEKAVSVENNSEAEVSRHIQISTGDGGGPAENIERIKSGFGDANAKVQASPGHRPPRSGIRSMLARLRHSGRPSKPPESTTENNSGKEGSYTVELPEQYSEAIARMKKKLPRIDEGSSGEPADRGKRQIFKIPTKSEEKEFVPQVVAIGPYYRCNTDLGSMGEIKWQCLAHLIHKSEKNLEVYWKKVHQLEQEARGYYSETIELSSVEFVEMMVLDGCFILEFFLFHSQQDGTSDEVHPIAGIETKMLPKVFSDLLLIGNQIPFPVLTGLFEICSDLFPEGTRLPILVGEVFLDTMGIEFWYSDLSLVLEYMNDRESKSQEPLHLLDMVRLCLLPPHLLERKITQNSQGRSRSPLVLISRSISKLRRAGIKVNLQDQDHFWEVGFQAGVIKMPKTVLNDLMCSFLVNCVEFEHSCTWKGISSYVVFLDCLVNTAEDVDFLRENRVLEHYKENDDVAADFINSLGKKIAFDVRDSDFSSLCKRVNKYYEKTLRRQKVWYQWLWQRLKREYKDKPWRWISVFAGLVLLILTFLQTYYAMRSYLHPKN